MDVAYAFGSQKPNPQALAEFLPNGCSEYSGATLPTRKAAARQLKLNLLAQLTMHIDAPDDVKALYNPKIFTQPTKAPADSSRP